MSGWSRRNWLASMALAAAGQGTIANAWQVSSRRSTVDKEKLPRRRGLALEDYEPKSMLHVTDTKVPRARFLVIDFHTHLSWSACRGRVTELHNNATVEEVLPVMDRKNVRIMVNLTGGYGKVLEQTINYWHRPHADRFIVFTEPWFEKITEAAYPQFQADQIARAHSLAVHFFTPFRGAIFVARDADLVRTANDI